MKSWLITLVLLLSPLGAKGWANSFLPRFIGGVDPGVPTHVTPTGIVTNPAVLGYLKGTNIAIYYSPVYQSLEADRASILSSTGNPGPGADISYPGVSYSNNVTDYFFGASTDFGQDRVTLGVAIFSPFRQDFSNPSAPLRYHLIDRSIINLFVTSVLALKVHRKFHIGFGLSYVYTKINMEMVRDRYLRGDVPDGSADSFEQGGKVDEKIAINTEDNNLGFQFGFYYMMKKWLFLGGSYRSKIRSLDSGYVRTKGTGSITRWSDAQGGYVTLLGKATLRTTFPESANIGIKMRFSRNWWGDLSLTWDRWSDHQKLQVLLSGNDFANSSLTNWDLSINSYRGFQDVFAPQLSFFFNQKTGFSFITSLRYSPPATPQRWVNPAAVDNHAIDFMLSTSFKLFNFMTIRVAYTLEYMLPVTVKDSGFDPGLARTCLDNHIDVAWCDECLQTMNNGQALPSAAGTYRKLTHQIGVGLHVKF
ncbi:outer membrane protein transport protein [Myxococcota bacterium]|nr:outer membrane protein transport protein [Myxococcota bacterium]